MVDLSSLFLKEYVNIKSAVDDVIDSINRDGYKCLVVHDNKDYLYDLDDDKHSLVNVCFLCF